jgi:DNA-binding MarR family transcriptional regulator
MSQATFSWFMANLRDAGLIEEGQNEKNRKERAYRVTEAGDMAFRFYAGPATNTIVKTVLESP